MLRLMIVDDEKNARDGLKAFVPWQSLGVLVAGEAEDGAAALEMLREVKPDLVLCDVRMPRMNGIDFAQKAKEVLPDCSIIFLSGFSDQEYLRSALRLGATDYIEKPLNIPELERAVRRVVTRLHEEAKTRAEHQANVLRALLGPEARLNRDSAGEGIASFLAGTRYRAWQLDAGAPAAGQPLEDWRERLAALPFTLLYAQGIEGRLTLLTRDLSPAEEARLEGVLLGERQGAGQGECALALSAEGQAWELPGLVSQAAEALDRRYLLGGTCPIRFELLNDLVFDQPPARLAGQLRALLGAGDTGGAVSFLNLVEEQLGGAHRTSDETARAVISALSAEVFSYLNSLSPGRRAREARLRDLLAGANAGSLQSALAGLVRQLRPEGGDQAPAPQIEGRILDIERYIQQNYHRDITLGELADAAGLSLNYLCSSYKQAFGMTIVQSILKKRMEEACALLEDSRLPVAEVARRAGFEDANYFSRAFRKLLGMSPSAYRMSIRP